MSAPEGVRLKFADGTVVDCRVERAPELDRVVKGGTVTYWLARPVRPFDPALTYQVECAVMPPMTGFKVDVSATDLDQAWFWTPEWQEGERRADADIAAGRLSGPYYSADELFAHLEADRDT